MNDISQNTDTIKDLYFVLDKALSKDIDKEIIQDLDSYLDRVRGKSKALASSLKRCFENARKSKRYVEAYNIGKLDVKSNIQIEESNLKEYLEEKLKDFFEKNDFMHYREFVRLLRACTIDVGGEVSSKIKEMYNSFFFGKRLIKAYKLGRGNELGFC
ncbi:MAG: hypothetical protein HYR97_08835 [Candidatus Melainabacteria bacterium]|nr:hypothetical protein [Candidatus Melainabacteria bacterium]MBI3309490.1 hypothetical protein [Candidatus Melainabacteria bacterium]